MDNVNNAAQNPVQTQPVVETPAPQPQVFSPTPNKSKTKIILLAAALIIIVVIAGIGYFYYSKTPKTYNATVYNGNQPTVSVTPSVSPTPYQANPNDISNQGLNQDSAAINQSMNSINSGMNNVDQSFNDQQTNLQ